MAFPAMTLRQREMLLEMADAPRFMNSLRSRLGIVGCYADNSTLKMIAQQIATNVSVAFQLEPLTHDSRDEINDIIASSEDKLGAILPVNCNTRHWESYLLDGGDGEIKGQVHSFRFLLVFL